MAGRVRSRSQVTRGTGRPGLFRLRQLVAGLTLASMLPFFVLARAHPAAARVALLTAAHGLFWLLVLRRHRARLRRHGLRW